jgi:hypothetical protein
MLDIAHCCVQSSIKKEVLQCYEHNMCFGYSLCMPCWYDIELFTQSKNILCLTVVFEYSVHSDLFNLRPEFSHTCDDIMRT